MTSKQANAVRDLAKPVYEAIQAIAKKVGKEVIK